MPSEQWAGYLCGIVLSPCSTLRDLAVQSVVAYHRFALTNLYVGRTRMCFPQEVVPSSICWFFWEQCPPIYPITPSAIRASTGKPADCWLASSRGYCVEFWNNYAVDGSCDSSRAAAAMIFLFLAPQKKSGHTCNSIWAELVGTILDDWKRFFPPLGLVARRSKNLLGRTKRRFYILYSVCKGEKMDFTEKSLAFNWHADMLFFQNEAKCGPRIAVQQGGHERCGGLLPQRSCSLAQGNSVPFLLWQSYGTWPELVTSVHKWQKYLTDSKLGIFHRCLRLSHGIP